MASPRTRSFDYEGHRLVYDEYGSGERPIVLMPGLLFSRRMHGPLAATLAEHGHRVICLDLLGHGDSDRPEEMWNYSMPLFGSQVIALLDHLDIPEAVVGGTSLGANTTLEAASQAPDRVRGMLVEMPVLDNALLGCAIGFTPLLLSLTFGAPVTRLLGRAAHLVPRTGWLLADMLLDWVDQDPKPSASVLQGLFFGRTAPPKSERPSLTQPTLVIGHPRDPIHPFSDADMLVHELPDARMVHAGSLIELRVSPERLTGEIVEFADGCWPQRTSNGGRKHSPVPAKSRSSRRPA
jgi:pimeloyl-ACP methyl ester carboxylesterase